MGNAAARNPYYFGGASGPASAGSSKSIPPKADMREALMSEARAAVQAHGYNALSFRELAKAVGIKPN